MDEETNKEKKMESSTSILDLNDNCKLEIIKYIIADCDFKGKFHGNKMKYLDLVRFALAHEDLEAVLELYHNEMENRTSILDLNDYCKLEIIKYIIADCELKGKSHGNKMKYLDLVRFALAHEDLEAVLELYHNDLYKALEFLFVANKERLKIDFAELQATHTGKEGDAFWRFFADAIRVNSKVRGVGLLYSPQSYQPDFLDNFQMIKRALENKKSLVFVKIDITGYCLDDLNNFGHIRFLDLNVRVSAEALATICKTNPHLELLSIMTTDILGRLSDIVPHCRKLLDLEFVAKPDVDLAEYAPLAQLPNLREMTIHGAFKNGSVLTMFEAMPKWQKPGNEFLYIVFKDWLPALSSVTLPRKDLLETLSIQSKDSSLSDSDIDSDSDRDCDSESDSHMSVLMKASYNCLELTADIDRPEKLYATFTIIDGVDFSVKDGERKLELRFLASRATELASLIKVLNVNTLDLRCSEENSQEQLVKLFGLLHPDGSFALRKLDTGSIRALDQFGTSELVKIQSLEELYCTFTDSESFEHLSKLTNLQEIEITVKEQLDERSLQALCNFLNNCHGNLHGNIEYPGTWLVRLNANQISLWNKSAPRSAENTLGRQALTYLQRNLSNSWNINNTILDVLDWRQQQDPLPVPTCPRLQHNHTHGDVLACARIHAYCANYSHWEN